jgi:hypothetical protein
MKSPSDDEINWDQLVARAIMGPEFRAAWETLKGSGIGSTEAISHVSNLIRGSRWHLERLEVQHAEIMKAAARAAQGGEVAHTKLDHQLAGALLTPAASYMVMRVMLGVATVARRLGLPEEDVLDECKPLVN